MKHGDSSVIRVKISETNEKYSDEGIFDTNAWRCEACGHIDYGYETSGGCPYCFYPDNAFKRLQAPGQHLDNALNTENRLSPTSSAR